MRFVLGICVITGSALLGGGHLKAHEGATGIVKERMDTMKSFGKAVTRMGDMLKGKIPYDGQAVQQGAQTITTHGGADLIALFPKGSESDESHALPAIWQNWTKFSKLAGELRTKAAALAAAADSQETFQPVFVDLTDTCKACHTKFRKKEEEKKEEEN